MVFQMHVVGEVAGCGLERQTVFQKFACGETGGHGSCRWFFFCTIWAKICDLDNLNTNLGMRHHGANDPCNWCSCNTSTRSWSQFGVDAAWLSHVYSSVDFLTQVLPVHPLFTLPGVTVHTLWPDLMHVKYMGVDMYLFGSILVYLVFTFTGNLPADSYGERLNRVWSHCLDYDRNHAVERKSRFSNMRIGMFTKEASWRTIFPKLKGRAAEVKHFGPALLHACRQMLDPTNGDHASMILSLEMSCKIDDILNNHPDDFMLPPPVATEFQGAVFVYMNHFGALARRFNADGRCLFNVTVKTHFLCHIALRCFALNPRRAWCFSGERFMLVQRRMIASCARGTPTVDINLKAMEKYRHALHLAMTTDEFDVVASDLLDEAVEEAAAGHDGAMDEDDAE